MRRFARALPLALAGLPALLAGCADGEIADLEAQVKELRTRSAAAENERDKLADRLATAERRLAGLQADLSLVSKGALGAGGGRTATESEAPPAEVATPAPAASVPATDPKSAAAAKLFEDLLASEEGRAAFSQAMRTYEAQRDQQRRTRMVNEMVEAFAQRANLSPHQKESMLKIATKTAAEIEEALSAFRNPDVPVEERTARRQEAFAKAQEIATRTDEEVKAVLDGAQWDMYQQERGRMRGFLGGGFGTGGPGGFGGRGGDPGR